VRNTIDAAKPLHRPVIIAFIPGIPVFLFNFCGIKIIIVAFFNYIVAVRVVGNCCRPVSNQCKRVLGSRIDNVIIYFGVFLYRQQRGYMVLPQVFQEAGLPENIPTENPGFSFGIFHPSSRIHIAFARSSQLLLASAQRKVAFSLKKVNSVSASDFVMAFADAISSDKEGSYKVLLFNDTFF